MKLTPINKCIYCGRTEAEIDGELTDEHIIPFSLGGTLLLKKSSCKKCADITSKFEGDITREGRTYFQLRHKNNFPSYRKRKPKSFSLTAEYPNGVSEKILIPDYDYPIIYPIFDFPPPGILSGQPLSDRNPEFKIQLFHEGPGFDWVREKYCPGATTVHPEPTNFKWGSFFRCLAKVAHSATVATFGLDGYEKYLPNIILGTSPYLSHYVGGLITGHKDSEIKASDGISISANDAGYVIVNIALLRGRTPNYSIVSAKFDSGYEALSFAGKYFRADNEIYDNKIKLRSLYGHDWALFFQDMLIHLMKGRSAVVERFWPFKKGFEFEAYSILSTQVVLIMKETDDRYPSGPDGFKKFPDERLFPASVENIIEIHNAIRDTLGLDKNHLIFVVPAIDSGISNARKDLELFSEIDKLFLDIQIKKNFDTLMEIAISKSKNID